MRLLITLMFFKSVPMLCKVTQQLEGQLQLSALAASCAWISGWDLACRWCAQPSCSQFQFLLLLVKYFSCCISGLGVCSHVCGASKSLQPGVVSHLISSNLMYQTVMHSLYKYRILLLSLLHAFPAKRQGASADKQQRRPPKSYPLMYSPGPSKTQPSVGTVLSICTGLCQPGPYNVVAHLSVDVMAEELELAAAIWLPEFTPGHALNCRCCLQWLLVQEEVVAHLCTKGAFAALRVGLAFLVPFGPGLWHPVQSREFDQENADQDFAVLTNVLGNVNSAEFGEILIGKVLALTVHLGHVIAHKVGCWPTLRPLIS